MSEVYRMMEDGTAPPMPEDGKCDAWTNKLVDDCRGVLCDRCMKAINERKDTEDMKAKTEKNTESNGSSVASDGSKESE